MPRAASSSSAAWPTAADRARIDEEKRKENKALLKRVKDALGDRVIEVRVSERLRDSPAVPGARRGRICRRRCAACWPPTDRRCLRAPPAFELNVTHPLVRYLDGVKEGESFGELSQLLFDQASLAEEGQIANRTGLQPPAQQAAGAAGRRRAR